MPTLFNHNLNPLLAYKLHSPDKFVDFEQHGGNYGARILGCTTPDDLVQSDSTLRIPYKYHYEHLGSVGLEVAGIDHIIWNKNPEVAHDYPDHYLSVYLFDSKIHAMRPDWERYNATSNFEDKNSLIKYCQLRGDPVPYTSMAVNGEPANLTGLQLPAYIKAAVSSNGKGISYVRSWPGLRYAISKAGPSYQIQEEVPGTPVSVLYDVKDGRAIHLATTDQIMNGHAHVGNRYPTEHDPCDITDPLAEALATAGLRDKFGLDVMVNDDDAIIIECNPRWTGATYPAIVAGRLAIEEWVACEIPTSYEHPKDIKLGNTLYDTSSKIGVIIMNNSRMKVHGKVEVLIAGPPEAQAEMLTKLERQLR